MHKEYIRIPKEACIDYTPCEADLRPCNDCYFIAICPYEYECATFRRWKRFYEMLDNDDTENGVDEA